MRRDDYGRLLLLGAIWGSSFLFMKIAVPHLGPVVLIEARVALAATFLTVLGHLWGKEVDFRSHWRHFLVVGAFNSAIPFLLLANAALTLSASLLSVLNATVPIWTLLLMALLDRQLPPLRRVLGVVLGIGGVAFISGFDPTALTSGSLAAVAMALGAALSYGVASTYARRARRVDPLSNAQGSMYAATFLIAPSLAATTVPDVVPVAALGAALALGIICSGVAYLIQFRLIADIGPAQTNTVTFLIPFFGIVYGHFLLGEPFLLTTLLGVVLVLSGTWLVL